MIYFIRGKESGNIKIGYSATPEKRKSNLQTSHYEELEFIGLMGGSLEDEAKIHETLARFNIRGEWYRPSSEVLEFVESNANKPNEHIVTSFGNGIFRITSSNPMKLNMRFLLLARTHKIQILTDSDGESQLVLGVQGERDILLNWLESLEILSPEELENYRDLMND